MKGKAGVIGVVPMGPLGPAVLDIIAANLQVLFSLPVDIVAACSNPEFALVEHRSQYHAAVIVQRLAQSRRPYPRLLGVVNVDLFIPVFTYVLGEAEMGGRAAVISLRRLRVYEDGAPVPLETFYERAAKVAVHELGHTFGLVHCHQQGCVMQFSSLVAELDRIPLLFCDYCQAYLDEAYRRYRLARLHHP